jgi:hypothetical protein
MIKREYINDVLIKTYSDQNLMIRKIGTEEIYDVAIDPIKFENERQYEETDIEIKEEVD